MPRFALGPGLSHFLESHNVLSENGFVHYSAVWRVQGNTVVLE